jgi:hypothetical protein
MLSEKKQQVLRKLYFFICDRRIRFLYGAAGYKGKNFSHILWWDTAD